MLSGIPFVGVTRGQRLESVHTVAACACDADGEIITALGSIDEPVFLRSAAKPFITAAGVQSGIMERFGFDDRELAVMSASHNGEPFHCEAIRGILTKIGATVADLQCGIHPPAYGPAAAALAARAEAPTALHNNCSGKHAAILALARALGVPFDGYLSAQHPAQRRILAFCERITGESFGADRLAIDGCGIPVYATSLRNAARSYARFATLAGLDAADAAALAHVRRALVAWPEYVAGTGRFDTDLMRAGGGRIACKAGAEAVHATAVLDGGFGLALKVVDGAQRAVAPAVLSILGRLGALDAGAMHSLRAHASATVANHAGSIVGTVAVLQAVGEELLA